MTTIECDVCGKQEKLPTRMGLGLFSTPWIVFGDEFDYLVACDMDCARSANSLHVGPPPGSKIK